LPGSPEARDWFLRGFDVAEEGAGVGPIKIGKLPRARGYEEAAEAVAPVRLAPSEFQAPAAAKGSLFDLRPTIDPDAGIRAVLEEAGGKPISIVAKRARLTLGEEIGEIAVKDVPEISEVLGAAKEAAKTERLATAAKMAEEAGGAQVLEAQAAAEQATQAAQLQRIENAAQAVAEARASGVAAERAAAEASGKGVVRQTVETALFGPTRVVNGAGEAVENAVRNIIGREAETALGRIAQDAVVKAARGAMEGGIYGLGNEAGHQFLQDDPDLSGERLASAWFHGAVLGGGFGLATGALGRGAKEAINRAVGNEGIAKFLSDKAGEHMWHAAGGTKAMSANATKYAGGVAKVGNLIRNDAEQIMGRTPRTREELAELAGLMQEKHAATLDAVLNRLDENVVGKDRVKLKDLTDAVKKLEDELKGRAANHAPLTSFKENVVDALGARDKLTGEINYNAPVSFKQLREFRRTVDESSKFTSNNPDAVRNSFRQLRHTLENEIETAAEPFLSKAGGSLLNDYKAAKAGYQAGKLLEKASASGVAAQNTNQFLSLTDKIFGIGAGAVVGHAAGPIGGFMSHQLAGYASKQVRKNFDFVVSDVLAKLANVAKGAHVLDAAQATSERVQKRMDQGMRSISKALDGKDVGAVPVVAGAATYEERSALILNAAAQHEGVLEHLNNVTSPLNRAAPNVAGALNAAALRTIVYLMDALPKPPSPPKDSLTPLLAEKKWKPSDPQKAEFNRKWIGAVQPELIPSLIARGEYTAAHDQAFRANHPKSQEKLADKTRKELDRLTKQPPAHMRTSLKLLLGVPIANKGLDRTFQDNYTVQPNPQPGPKKPLKTVYKPLP
jgi:hypothetical protein